MEEHTKQIYKISSQIRQFHASRTPFRIYHGSTNSTRPSGHTRARMVDTSHLTGILSVDTSRMTAVVEPNVPMDALVSACLQQGLVPPVVMEFPGITVGGGFSGTSGESSSFRYGFFDRTINWIEIVIPNGDILRASPREHTDLFYGAAASFGTLGVVTLLEIQLIEAHPYVELTYRSMDGMKAGIEQLLEYPSYQYDYIDAILFSKDEGVIVTGKLVDSKTANDRTPSPYGERTQNKIQTFTRPSDPWFYLHARQRLREDKRANGLRRGSLDPRRSSTIKEYVPITDYLFRYDRGGFWVGKYAFSHFFTPFNRITRYILDYFMHTRVMYHALHESGYAKQYIIQDVAIPYEKAPEFVQYLDDKFGHYPIWLCPLKQTGLSAESSKGLMALRNSKREETPDLMLNFGVWGPGPRDRRSFVNWNRAFEHKVHKLGGQKWLYAHAYYTEAEWNEIYEMEEYNQLRHKYHADYLPSVYDKVKVNVESEESRLNYNLHARLVAFFWTIWPLAGLYGVWKAWIGGDYLLPKNERRTAKELKKIA